MRSYMCIVAETQSVKNQFLLSTLKKLWLDTFLIDAISCCVRFFLDYTMLYCVILPFIV